ncbi:efflux RND transporter periplasmic adaptor subunit [Botrimarina sp.]|uniref:efflux RND transporter periplasmic adaptor subunit n=1 Tax=Botrimarina sp. TaxID=2795802 RepID=UPI0032EB24FC
MAAGWFGFEWIADEIDKPPPPAAKEVFLRTRVELIEATDYPVVVRTNAVVQAHNPVTLAAEVTGKVARVSPSFLTGAYFSDGEVLVEIDPRDYQTALSIARSELAASQSALKLAELNEERKLRLIEDNAVSQAEVDGASATREQAEADVELAKTRVVQAELNLERTRVVAPFDGRVRTNLVGVGQIAAVNSPLGEVFAVDFAEVRLPISGEQRRYLDLPEFPDDPPVRATLRDAIGGSNDHVWDAEIVRTEGVLDADSRDVVAIARVDDPFGRQTSRPPLRIGQPVTAAIEGQTLNNVVALPRGAVRELDKIVLVDRSDQTLLSMNIEPVWSDSEHVVVPAEVIPEGKWLATTPMPYTPEGSRVEIIPEASPAAESEGGAGIAQSSTDAGASGVAN